MSRIPYFIEKPLIDGGNVVSLKPRQSSTTREICGTGLWAKSRVILGLEGLDRFKFPMTSSGKLIIYMLQ
jgi:hypothetical protein